MLTNDAPWDPSDADLLRTQGQREMGALHIDRTTISATYRQPIIPTTSPQCDILMSNVSSIYSDSTLLPRMIAQIRVADCHAGTDDDETDDPEAKPAARVSIAKSGKRHPTVTAEQLSQRWNIGLETARMTLNASTQYLVRSATQPLSRRYKTDWMQTKYRRLSDQWYSDTMFPKTKSIKGRSAVQVLSLIHI